MRISINKKSFVIGDRFIPVYSVYTVDRFKVIFFPEKVSKTISGKVHKGIICTALVDETWYPAVLWQNDVILYYVSGKPFMLCREAGTYEKVSEKVARVSDRAAERAASIRRLDDALEVSRMAPHLRQERRENWLQMKY